SQQRVDAREDFLEMERLDDVVIRTRGQPVHLVLPPVARGQNEDRVRLALLAQRTDHVQPGYLRQAEIDDREIDRVFEREIQPFTAVAGALQREAVLGELPAQRLAQD